MTTTIILREYDFLYVKKNGKENTDEDSKAILINEDSFAKLKTFIYEQQKKYAEDALDFFSISTKKGFGEIIQAKNYVGVIQMKNYVIEILPKIANIGREEETDDKVRKIFLKMLKSLKDSPFKTLDTAKLKTKKFNILEVFISMFLNELEDLVREGIKSDYVRKEENLNFFKGKLNVLQNIKKNYIHQERFYMEYDDFIQDIPENRLIKSTLNYLGEISKSLNNQKKLMEYKFIFDEIEKSKNIEADFGKCKSDRLMSRYKNIIHWCRIFLQKKSFVNQHGKDEVQAILFPMEKIFESYIAYKMRKKGLSIETQVTGKYLIEGPTRKFALKPDIVLYDKENRRDIKAILDTKWKLLNSLEKNSGISQSDIYQMYAYGKKIYG